MRSTTRMLNHADLTTSSNRIFLASVLLPSHVLMRELPDVLVATGVLAHGGIEQHPAISAGWISERHNRRSDRNTLRIAAWFMAWPCALSAQTLQLFQGQSR